MKADHPEMGYEGLCDVFGKSRQGWYQADREAESRAEDNGRILSAVENLRATQPRLGARKLHYLLQGRLSIQGVKIGRDALLNLLRTNGLLIRRRKRFRPQQTDGKGESIYPDLRKGLEITEVNQLWSADITYLHLRTTARFCYATLVVDEKSHRIVGYHVATDMTAPETRKALERAVKAQVPSEGKFGNTLIFHTDRGSQFKSAHVRQFLHQYEIQPSMSEAGKSEENPVSERLNGILKDELRVGEVFDRVEHAQTVLAQAVQIYNTQRPHLSCNLLTPEQAHQAGLGPLKKLWKSRRKQPQAV
ncbi:MAG: IS3 family transposase [Bacteroidia bacterium]|nr:IS3 family transposase [Bacteroidia bacterium]